MSSLSKVETTIRNREERMERALDLLRSTLKISSFAQAQDLISELQFCLSPIGYRATVQLEEGGRKKRATAAASNWNFDRGEIKLFYEPQSGGPELVTNAKLPQEDQSSAAVNTSLESLDEEVRQCCEALAEAEKTGKLFIAFKSFRDVILAGKKYNWSATPEERAQVLQEAIKRGAIETRKIPNPKAPSYPTTTVRLVPSQDSPVKIGSRYNPVPIQGEPASVTMLRDRGTY